MPFLIRTGVWKFNLDIQLHRQILVTFNPVPIEVNLELVLSIWTIFFKKHFEKHQKQRKNLGKNLLIAKIPMEMNRSL